jgi:hypothetical protein
MILAYYANGSIFLLLAFALLAATSKFFPNS